MARTRTTTKPSARGSARRKAAAKANKVDFGPLADRIGFFLRLAQNAAFQAFAKQARGIDVSPGRFTVLMVIGRNPGISQTALSRAVGIEKSTLTPALRSLVKHNIVRRTRTEKDRRTYRLTLTPAGEKLLRDLSMCAERHDKNLDAIVGPRDRARFIHLLRKIAIELS